MMDFLRRLIKPRYETLNRVEIKADSIIANYNYLKSLQPEAEIFPVLKSNAYGHGLKEMCRILDKAGARFVAVDSFPEAQIAYRHFRGKVLILGEMPLRAYSYCKLRRTEFVVYNDTTLKYLSRFGRRAKIHLFVNSGMNREGIKDLDSFLERNRHFLEKIEVSGLCSHLAAAEEESVLNDSQLESFSLSLDKLRSAGFFPRWVHLGNSAAAFRLKSRLFTAYRPGLALYGYDPIQREARPQPLQPALEVFSRVVSVQDLVAGEAVSYNGTYRAERATRLAVIPFGYFEGLNRHLSNRASFRILSGNRQVWAKVAGRVCMNLTCLDVGQHPVFPGDQVQVISSEPGAPNSIEELAALSGTISYEFLVKLQPGIRRDIV